MVVSGHSALLGRHAWASWLSHYGERACQPSEPASPSDPVILSVSQPVSLQHSCTRITHHSRVPPSQDIPSPACIAQFQPVSTVNPSGLRRQIEFCARAFGPLHPARSPHSAAHEHHHTAFRCYIPHHRPSTVCAVHAHHGTVARVATVATAQRTAGLCCNAPPSGARGCGRLCSRPHSLAGPHPCTALSTNQPK